MRTPIRFLLLIPTLTLVILGMSCSSVTAKRVQPQDYDTEGVRYWLCAPYLLVRAPVEVKRTETLFQLTAGEAFYRQHF